MLFMVIEHFNDNNPIPIYERLRERSRALPEGLVYIDSWIAASFDRCFQVMECEDITILQQWILQWRDLCRFEVIPVNTSKKVAELTA